MKKILFASLFGSLSLACSAGNPPVVGLLQQYPVMGDGVNVTARPIYIFTHQKLEAPVVFSGLKGASTELTVLCCFEVTDIAPLDLKAELTKYRSDADFVAHIKGVKGYRYIYAARPVSNRTKWTPLMKTVMSNAANPDDGTPFSVPVIQANFDKSRMPATFILGGSSVSLTSRYAENGLNHHAFKVGNQTTVLSEPSFSD